MVSELESHQRLLAEVEKTAARLVLALSGLSDEIVQRPLRDRLQALSRKAEGHRLTIGELEDRLSQRAGAVLGIEQVMAAMLALYERATNLGEFMDGADDLQKGPVLSLEQKRKVLQALGCR